MIIHYLANGLSAELPLPSSYVENCTAEALAELAASDFWRNRPGEQAPLVTLLHLANVDGRDLGIYEVRRVMRPVFNASPL